MTVAGNVLSTRVDPQSERFRPNREMNLELLSRLPEQLEAARAGGGPEKLAKHRSRGKLTIRERIVAAAANAKTFRHLEQPINASL
jgi:acetyl-CoA carboxylase carboxyltransferase component